MCHERTYVLSNCACSFFVDDPRLVLRIPATIFSMATLALLAYMGWRWFDPYVAFLAAVLYAISPHTIGMADFGRYLSQVQFFTLLTMYLTYEAVRGTGPPPLALIWGAAISFIAMYLSWEGTGFFGIGLACPYCSSVAGICDQFLRAHPFTMHPQSSASWCWGRTRIA